MSDKAQALPAGKRNQDILKPRNWVMTAYLLPGLVLFTLVFIFPIIFAFYCGFFEFNSISNMEFAGGKYYIRMMQDQNFWDAFLRNLYLVFGCLIGQIGIAFLLANLINSRLIRLPGVHRVISFFPVTLSAVVVGFVWSMLYDYKYGLINFFLRLMGLDHVAKDWLSTNSTVMTCVNIPMIWQYVGLHLIIILAAMSSVDKEIYEMAELDGANGFQRAFKITFPLIKNTLIVCAVLCISGNMKAFDHIYAMTLGGPGYASTVMALYAYNVSFSQFKLPYGSALSIGIFVLSLLLVMVARFIMTYLSREKKVRRYA